MRTPKRPAGASIYIWDQRSAEISSALNETGFCRMLASDLVDGFIFGRWGWVKRCLWGCWLGFRMSRFSCCFVSFYSFLSLSSLLCEIFPFALFPRVRTVYH